MTIGDYFACFKLGAIAVPLNMRLKHAEIGYVLGHSEARLYIGEPGLYEHGATTPRSLPANRFSTEESGDGFAPFAGLLAVDDESALPTVSATDPAAILYTSGTTARPKGVTHSHESLRQTALSTLTVGYRQDDVFLTFCPLAHMSGLGILLLPAVMLAAETALVPRFEPTAILRTLARRRCTATFGLPAGL